MTSIRFQQLVKECIQEVLQEEVHRVCMYCELIAPAPHHPNKSHGYCREHYIAMVIEHLNKPLEIAVQMADRAEEKQGFAANTSGAKETDPLPKHEDQVFNK